MNQSFKLHISFSVPLVKSVGQEKKIGETNTKPLELSFDALPLSYGELECKAKLYTSMASVTFDRASEGKSGIHIPRSGFKFFLCPSLLTKTSNIFHHSMVKIKICHLSWSIFLMRVLKMKSLTLSSNVSILAWSGSVKIQKDKNTTSIISNAAIVTSRWLSLIA